MSNAKAAENFKAGEIIGLEFGNGIGGQWATVQSVEIEGYKAKITVKMPKRFGYRIVSKVYETDQRLITRDFEEFKKWCEMYKIDFF